MPALTARSLVTFLATLLVGLALMAVAGCGDDDDDDAPGGGDSTSQATDAPDSGDDDGSGGEAEGACLLSEDEVADATGEDVTATQISGSEPHDTCQYSFASATSGMNINLFFGEDLADAQALFDASDEEEPVEGLGDAAEWSEESTLLKVLVDDIVLGVEFFGLPPEAEGALSILDAREIAIGIAEAAIPRLPEADPD